MKALRFLLILAVGLISSSTLPASQSTPEQAQTSAPKRIPVGEQVMAPKLIHQVVPKYPKEAKAKHITGTVRVAALVGRDGKVIQATVMSGDPMLAKAATEALLKCARSPCC